MASATGVQGTQWTASSDNFQERLKQMQRAHNPILDAAQPLLRALADMPNHMEAGGLEVLRRSLEQEVKTFTQLCEQANVRRDHMLATRYTLCSALDEAASRTSWGGGVDAQTGPWSTQALLNTFHKESFGGKTVFLLIGRMASQPHEHMHVLEVLFQVLGLGFEGHYHTESNGPRMLETIRHRLYSLISASREPVPAELSRHWLPSAFTRFKLLRQFPLWMAALIFSLILLTLYGWSKYQLAIEQKDVVEKIEGVGALKVVAAPQRKLRLKEVLSEEITQGLVAVTEDGLTSKVDFRSDGMFVSARADLTLASDPLLKKIAEAIKSVSGRVQVVGHSDNVPIKTRQFPNNEVLSKKRADAVAQALEKFGVSAQDIQTQGVGDSMPIAENSTSAGRALNRRVELEVME
ncbi:type VI secretion system protein TssL, long form [Comamonas composti]|uniref:type VI secretion system protein TssL, long form n=1 Tax=Comamonas composti TaxID=408558 RepID=UPI0003F95CD6|nr:type VI secretion system protein TssL, long form [Comamonas composti]